MAYPNPSSAIPLMLTWTDGPTLTAAAAASCIPVANRLILPTNYWSVGKKWRLLVQGRLSCAVTTPGTAQFDLRTGPTGTITAFSTGPINLNVAGKTTVPFELEANLICRAVGTGTATQLFGIGRFTSEAIVGAAANAAGGNSVLMVPVGLPTVGTGFDNTAANAIDLFFTQSVATGSMTVHNMELLETI